MHLVFAPPNMKKIFLYTSIYTALGAALACFATDTIFGLPLIKEFYLFLFFATLCTYNVHWYFTPTHAHNKDRENWSVANKKILASISIVAFVVGIYFLYMYLWKFVLYILPLVLISILYTAPKIPYPLLQQLRKFVIAKTLYLSIAWTYATVILPLLLHQTSLSDINWQYAFHRFTFILIICGLFDYKDRIEDAQGGIKSMLAMAGVGIVGAIMQVLISMSMLSNFRLVPYLSTVDILLNFVPLIAIMVFYKKSIQTNSEVWYYFVLDGLIFINGAIYAILFSGRWIL
jgi:hypothetical protein